MEFLNVKKIKNLLSPYLTPCGFGVCWLQIVLFQMPPLLPPCLSLSSVQMVCLRRDNYWSCLTYREHIVRNTLSLVLASSLKVLVGSCGLKQTLIKVSHSPFLCPKYYYMIKAKPVHSQLQNPLAGEGEEKCKFHSHSHWAFKISKSFMFGAGRMENWENGPNLKSSICRRQTRTTSGLRMRRKIPVSSLNDFEFALFF